MIDLYYDFGNAEVSCDKCNYSEMFEGFDGKVWYEIITDQMKEDGWKITYKNGDFEHLCPSCAIPDE